MLQAREQNFGEVNVSRKMPFYVYNVIGETYLANYARAVLH